MECIFGNPLIVVKTGDTITFEYPTATNQNFVYASATCVFAEGEVSTGGGIEGYATSVSVGENQFFLLQSYTYGELLIVFFLSTFTIAVICKAIWKFINPYFRIKR